MNKQTLNRLITTSRLLDANCLHSEARAIELIVKRASSEDDLLSMVENGEDSREPYELSEEKSFNPFSHLEPEEDNSLDINEEAEEEQEVSSEIEEEEVVEEVEDDEDAFEL